MKCVKPIVSTQCTVKALIRLIVIHFRKQVTRMDGTLIQSLFLVCCSAVISPPGVVTVTTVNYNTALVTWSSVPGVLFYQVSLMDSFRLAAWNTSATSLTVPNLKPCSSYTIGVSSINMFLQPGEPSTVPYTTSREY